jgi:hypothetical protein
VLMSKRRSSGYVMSAVLTLGVSSSLAWGSASGLNNIPTADVVGERHVVLQQWTNFGTNQGPTQYIGVKGSPYKNIEVGLDGKIGPTHDVRGPLLAQGKIRVPVEQWGTAFALGAANMNGDSDRAGRIFPYAVVSQEITKLARTHFGFDWQDDNEGFFAGLDTTIPLFDRDFVPRIDVIQSNHRRDLLGSVGFLYSMHQYFILEGWYSFSTDSAGVETFTVKVNMAF